MRFQRENKDTAAPFLLLLVIAEIGALFWLWGALPWYWLLLALPATLLLILMTHRSFLQAGRNIFAIELLEEVVEIEFINGKKRRIPKEKISYALLIQRFHQPLRAIEIREKRRWAWRSDKRLGVMKPKQWEDLRELAKHLIAWDFERRKWVFGFSFGDMLALLALIIMTGGAVLLAGGDFESGGGDAGAGADIPLANLMAEAADIAKREEQRVRDNHKKVEEKFLDEQGDIQP